MYDNTLPMTGVGGLMVGGIYLSGAWMVALAILAIVGGLLLLRVVAPVTDLAE